MLEITRHTPSNLPAPVILDAHLINGVYTVLLRHVPARVSLHPAPPKLLN